MPNIQNQLIVNLCSLRPPRSSIQSKLSTILDLFMQNKANFQKVKFYATYEMTRTYAKWTHGVIGKTKPNKANSKPIKANLQNAQNERKTSFNKGLRKMSTWAIYKNKANSKPKQTQFHLRPKECNRVSIMQNRKHSAETEDVNVLTQACQNGKFYETLVDSDRQRNDNNRLKIALSA